MKREKDLSDMRIILDGMGGDNAPSYDVALPSPPSLSALQLVSEPSHGKTIQRSNSPEL